VVRWPDHIEPGTVSDRMINLVDIFATFQELVSGEVLPPGEAAADSYSFYDELIGKPDAGSIRPHMVVNSVNGTMAIRKGPWKYVEGIPAKPLTDGARNFLAKELEPQLYNLEEDISESTNVIGDNPGIKQDLQATLDRIREQGSERMNTQ
jgi:arylsulfatase A-like enzyme